MIFDRISVKARWERWCRWNCDLRVVNARKKAFSVVPKASPWRQNMHICALRHSGESLQNCQLERRRWSWYLARETHKDKALSVWACQAGFWKSTRTSYQQQNCQNWQYGLVISYFPHHRWSCTGRLFILRWVDWSVSFDRLFISLCRLIKHDWSMAELQWSWISYFSVYHDRNYYYILLPRLWANWLNHQRVTICFL